MCPSLPEQAIADLARQRAQTKDGKQQLESQVAALKEELKIKDSANEAAQVPAADQLTCPMCF